MMAKKRSLRHLTLVLLCVIVFWWTYDHVVPYLPDKTYDYLPDLDEYVPDYMYELEMPKFELEWHKPTYNESKVALLIENRPLPNLAPLMLHFMSVVPPDWKFLFMGTSTSITHVNTSAAIRRQVADGKLNYSYIPSHIRLAGQEDISQFLTNLWLYEEAVQPAEWLLIFQSDSVICANSLDSIDNYLEYDWVGAPWYSGSRYGGNGGLSLRRVSSIMEVLRHQQRANFSDPEDVWLTERLGHLPQYRTANGTVSNKFSGEMNWVDTPMGYHIGTSGAILNGGMWGTLEKRKKIWDYCPEVKMTLAMDVERLMGDKFCNENF